MNTGLTQTQPLTQLLSHERIWIMSLLEQSFQFIQLLQSEISPRSSLFIVIDTVAISVVSAVVTVIVMSAVAAAATAGFTVGAAATHSTG